MRYWGYLIAKLCAIAALAYFGAAFLGAAYPAPQPFLYVRQRPFAHDLTYTFVMLGWFLFCMALLYAAILDTRYRCRTCLRRLRMPIKTGSWSHVLLGPSKTEYICTYGHGTLKVFEIQSSGPHPPDWQAHDDIWKELFSSEETRK
jgi:hypothetical protein